MQEYPSISVLIVTWNGWHHLQDCLPSILSQDYPREKIEVLVVDNGSTDGTVERLEAAYPQVRLIRNQENQGFAEPNNVAAREARGDFVALLNNDMRADASWLKEAVRCLDEAAGRICIASRILSWDGKAIDFQGGALQFLGYAEQLNQGKSASDFDAGAESELLFPCGGAMLIQRRVFLDCGGFDPSYFAIYEDVDLGWRLRTEGFRVVLAPKSRVYHKLHGTLSKAREEKMRYLMHRNALFTIFKNYGDASLARILPTAVVAAVRRALFFSGADRQSFYLWGKQQSEIPSSGIPPEHILWQSREAINHLVVLDDFFKALPDLWIKRAEVQKRRRLPDEQIFSLFCDPFRAIVVDPGYEETELRLVDRLQLDALFTDAGSMLETRYGNHIRSLQAEWDRIARETRELETQKRRLELEIEALGERQAGELRREPDPPQPLPSGRKSLPALYAEFFRHLRQSGWQEAWRQTRRFFSRQWNRRKP